MAIILADDFTDNSFDTSKWTESTNSNSLVVEQNSRLELASNSNYSGWIRSNSAYPIQNTQIILKCEQHSTDYSLIICPTLPAADSQYDVYAQSNWYNIHGEASLGVQLIRKNAGSINDVGSSTTASVPYWVRIRIADNTIYFDIANQDAEPAEEDWSNIASESWGIGSLIEADYYIFLTAYNTPSTAIAYVKYFDWESVVFPPGDARITHAVVEVLRAGDPDARITHAVVEVLRGVEPPSGDSMSNFFLLF